MPKRPAVALAVGIAGGLALAHLLYGASLWWWFACAVAAGGLLLCLFLMRRGAFGGACCLLAAGLTGALLYQAAAPAMPPIPSVRGEIAGTVEKVVASGEGEYGYLLSGVTMTWEGGETLAVGGRTMLWDSGGGGAVMPGEGLAAREVSLRLPSGPRNPGGFNARMYGFSQGYHYIAYAERAEAAGGMERPIASALLRARIGALAAIDELWPNPEENAILRALLLGDTSRMEGERADAFSRLGIAHVLAVSGLHVGFVMLLLELFCKGVFLLLPRRHAWLWGKFAWARAALIMAALLCYAAVTGFSPSTVRALLMACAVQAARASLAASDGWSTLCAAVFAMLLFRPMDLFSSSFQLSVTAVAGILLLGRPTQRGLERLRAPRWLAASLSVSGSAQLGILPLLARSFNRVPLLGLLANLFAVPLAGFAVVAGLPTLLLYAVSPAAAAVPAYPVMLCARLLSRLAVASAQMPLVSIEVASPPVLLMALYWSVLLLAAPDLKNVWGRARPWLLGGCGAAAAAACVVWGLTLYPPAPVLTTLDVGQGHATVLRHGDTALLFDAGPSSAPSDAAAYYNLRYDGVFLSHGDADHAAALPGLIREGRVERLIVPRGLDAEQEAAREALLAAAECGVPVRAVGEGDEVALGDLVVTIHAPLPGRVEWGENANMLVCSVSLDGRPLALFPGDLSFRAERGVAFPPTRVLLASHHGSDHATSAGLLSVVGPELAVIPVGRNTYGHPGGGLLDRLAAAGARIERTDEAGAVEVSFGDELSVKTWGRER